MIDGRRVLAIVPARGGSTRLAAKNARMLAGRPMVAWTLAASAESRVIDHLVVSTDDPAVAAVATEMGWPPPFVRPDHLSGAAASVIDAVEHALIQLGGDWDYVVLLQPTSPLRTAADIDGATALCDRSGAPAVSACHLCPNPQPSTDRSISTAATPPAIRSARPSWPERSSSTGRSTSAVLRPCCRIARSSQRRPRVGDAVRTQPGHRHTGRFRRLRGPVPSAREYGVLNCL